MMVKLKSFHNLTSWIKHSLGLIAIVLGLSLYALDVLGHSVEFTPDLAISDVRAKTLMGNALCYLSTPDDTSTARKQGQPSGHRDSMTPEHLAVDRATRYLTPHANKTGHTPVVNEFAGDGRHKNGNDFRLLAQSRKFRFDKILIPPDDRKIAIPQRDEIEPLPEIKLSLRVFKDRIWEHETARFEATMSPSYRNIRYQFNFGDGTENIWTTKPVIDHVYDKKGTYRVFVSVILNDISYISNLATINVDKRVSRPIARIHPAYLAIIQGEKALFESQSTYEQEVSVKESWSGPGDQKATGRMFEVDTNQLQPQRYEIALNLSDTYRQSDRTTAILEVLPSVKYTVSLDANFHRIEQNQVLTLKASLTPDIHNEEYRFNFGDGIESAWATLSIAEHVYSLPGIYRVFVAARSKDQILATSSVIQIEVTSKTVYTVFLEADKKNLFITEDVNFTGNIQPARERVLYQFDFGDGMRSDWLHEPETRHRYSNPGIYTARLTAKIGDELIRSNNVTITVVMASIRVSLEAEPTHTEPDQTVMFRANLKPPTEKAEYRFIFGDGGIRDWSPEAMAEHTYSEPGNYHAYVVSRIDQKAASESNPVIVRITSRSQGSKLWVGISAGLLVFLGGGGYAFLRMKRLGKADKHFKQTIQVRPHKDMGLQHIESDVSVQTGFEVRLKSVLDSGKQDIEPKGPLIIEEQEEP